MALPWAESALPLVGASELAEVAAGFTFPLPSCFQIDVSRALGLMVNFY